MRSTIGVLVLALALGCGNMGGGGNNNNGGSGGTGGGGTGGTGGTGGGGTGGGGNGGGGSGGSGGGSGGTPDYTSGTRIKVRTISSADGARVAANFYDTMLSTTCSFGHAADDTLRCLPTAYAYIGTYWADSGCSTPLAFASLGCATGYATKSETATTCVDNGYYPTNQRTRIYALGSAYTGTVWAGTPASCSMTTPAYPVYSVGSEVPAANFAAGSVDTVP